MLIQSDPGTEMFLECMDDVEFQEQGSPEEILQLKHSVRDEARLTDASQNLWRTIQHWIELTFSEYSDTEDCNFLLVSSAEAPQETIAACLGPGEVSRDSGRALERMEEVARDSSSNENSDAYEAFLELGSERRRALVEKIRVLDGAGRVTDLDDLLKKKLRKSVRPEYTGNLLERLEGWWHQRVIKHLTEPDPEPITELELVYKINDLSEQFGSESLPIDFLDLDPPSEEELDPEERVFINQLRLIDVQQERIHKAITDYYRAYRQRSRWAREELLNPDELDEYENRLVNEWERYFLAVNEGLDEDAHDQEKVEKGRDVYRWVELEADIRIRPKVSEPYVVRGSYQMLSNKCEVGWHPDFRERLEELIARAEERAS